jgi:outer membrane protein assembly factor BamB
MTAPSLLRGLLLGSILLLIPFPLQAGDWLQWRGPEQNGVSREKDLPDRWSTDPKDPDSNLWWKAPYGCRSTPLVMGKRVYIINSAGMGTSECERIMCFDADSGKVLWEYRFNVWHCDIVSSRVGWTNLAGDAETGNIYAHGSQGLLLCLTRDGKLVWERSLTEEYGRISGYGGRLASPVIEGDLVIVGMVHSSWGDYARGGNRFVAFNKRDGTVVWWSEPGGAIKGTYYSTPVVTNINGQRLLISGGADGAIHAMKVRTGEPVWSYEFCKSVINSSPVVQGNLVYIGHGEENLDTNLQGRVVCLDAGKVKDGKPALVWEKIGLKAGYCSPIVDGKFLYVASDSARLTCFDAASGDRLWEHAYGRLGRGSPVLADGKIYVAEVNSRFHILQPTPSGCKSLHSQFFPGSGGAFVEVNGSPAVADGRIYFGTRDEFFCIGKKNHKAKADPIPAQQQESPPDPKAAAAHLQVYPADVVLHPGESVTFKLRAYDAQGRFLREIPAEEWSLPTPPPPPGKTTSPPPIRGVITETGKLTVNKEVAGQQGYAVARVGKLTGRARVRVVPELPIRYDFSKLPQGSTPGGWVNAQGKYLVVQMADGSIVLKKLANDPRPPIARAIAYLNMPGLTDYTIDADLLGKMIGENLPDMGIVNCRYILIFDGNKQQLRLISWEALPRVDHSIPWKWAPDVWYRMRLRVEPQGNRAVIKGKVWPRDQPEPKDWSITYEDTTPNLQGAPGLYGYALGILPDQDGTEIYYNNVAITRNR